MYGKYSDAKRKATDSNVGVEGVSSINPSGRIVVYTVRNGVKML